REFPVVFKGRSTFAVNFLRIEGPAFLDEAERGASSVGPSGDFPVETAAPPGVAGSFADLLDVKHHRVLVAVGPDLQHPLDVAGGLPLVPDFLAAARPIDGLPEFQ